MPVPWDRGTPRRWQISLVATLLVPVCRTVGRPARLKRAARRTANETGSKIFPEFQTEIVPGSHYTGGMHIASRTTRPAAPASDVSDSRKVARGNGASEASCQDGDTETSIGDQDTRSDAELLSQFVQSHDPAAFAAIVERYQRLVMGVALRQVGDRHRAEDVFQATFLVLAEKAHRIRRPEALPNWLHGTARRIGLAALAESRRHPAMNRTDQTDTSDPVLQQMQSAYERQVLDEELAGLPERLRLPLVLHYLEGLTGRQVADRLGLSVDTVEGRLKKGRKDLRQRLVRQGVGFGAMLAAFQMSQQMAVAATTPLVEATAASSVAWVTHQPLEACTANAARLAGKDIAAMTAAKTTTIVTCTAIACLGTGLIGSWALGAGDGNGRGAAPAISGIGEVDGIDSSEELAADIAYVDPFGESADGVQVQVVSRNGNNEGVSNYQKQSVSREMIESSLDDVMFEDGFTDASLMDLASILEQSYGIPVRFDDQALDDEGIAIDALVVFPSAELPLRDTLELVLENVAGSELDYVIEHGVLKITTVIAAEEHLETVIYELRHLYPNHQAEDIAELIERMTSGVWYDTDGTGGTIVELPGAVAVRQTQRVHREIAALLDQVEEFAARSDLPEIERVPRATESRTAAGGGSPSGFGGGDGDDSDDNVDPDAGQLQPSGGGGGFFSVPPTNQY